MLTLIGGSIKMMPILLCQLLKKSKKDNKSSIVTVDAAIVFYYFGMVSPSKAINMIALHLKYGKIR